MLHLGVITLFPNIFDALRYGVSGRALKNGQAKLNCWNPRDWAINSTYQQVDDKPYGGGPGMVMLYEPLHAAIKYGLSQMPPNCKCIYLSPQGRTIKQSDLNNIASAKQALLFVAGRYEGIDERVIISDIDEEWSLGDFVLSGGELAAAVFIDALLRLLPGSLGAEDSAEQDSFMQGLLDYPHYTKPRNVSGLQVPEVLTSGDHKQISRWRRKQALGNTWLKKSYLLENMKLSEDDIELLIEFKREFENY